MLATLLLLVCPALAGEEQRGYLGVQPAPLDEALRARFQIPAEVKGGAVLLEVMQGTPAQKAGWQAGDVVTFLDRRPIASVDDLRSAIDARRASEEVTWQVRRGAQVLEGTLKLGAVTEMAGEAGIIEVAPGRRPLPEIWQRFQDLRERALRQQELQRRMGGGATPGARFALGPWVEREERALVEATHAGNLERAAYHLARLELLREMGRTGPGAPPTLEARLSRIEERLDEITRLLKNPK